MEYSVPDLLKILIRNWRVIIGSMLIIGLLSVFTSRASYKQVVQDYEAHTEEIVQTPVKVGITRAVMICEYEVLDYEILAESPYLRLRDAFEALARDAAVSASVNDAFGDKFEPLAPGTPLRAYDHFAIEVLESRVVHIAVNDLPMDVAEAALNVYAEKLVSVGASTYNLSVEVHREEYNYTEKPIEYTQSALFARTVMKAPAPPSSFVRTIGTAMLIAFVFSCFGVLVATFVKDIKRAVPGAEHADH